MDESIESELGELEARCEIIKNELATGRAKLQEKKQEILSAALHYEEMERRLKTFMMRMKRRATCCSGSNSGTT